MPAKAPAQPTSMLKALRSPQATRSPGRHTPRTSIRIIPIFQPLLIRLHRRPHSFRCRSVVSCKHRHRGALCDVHIDLVIWLRQHLPQSRPTLWCWLSPALRSGLLVSGAWKFSTPSSSEAVPNIPDLVALLTSGRMQIHDLRESDLAVGRTTGNRFGFAGRDPLAKRSDEDSRHYLLARFTIATIIFTFGENRRMK